MEKETMSQGRQIKSSYVHGSAAPRLDVRTAIHEAPTRETLQQIRDDNKYDSKMPIGISFVLFFVLAMTITGYALISNLKLQADITQQTERISGYEQQLYNLTLANDDEYSKMVKAVDLDYVREVAINDLGMVYADENQIVKYTRENSDYVRQFKDISE